MRLVALLAAPLLLLAGSTVQATPGGGLLWSSLNTTKAATNGNNSTAVFTNGPTFNANQTSVFVGSAAGLIAFDVLEGTPTWLTPNVKLAPLSRPAVGASSIFVHTAEGNLTAFDNQSGKQAWTVAIPGAGGSTPVLSPGEEIVYVGGYALYARDGKRLWALPNAGPEANVTGNPALHPDGTQVFVGDEEGGLLALDAMTGDAIWAVAAYGAIRGTPIITGDGRAVLVAAADGVLYALSTAQGGLIWSHKFGKGPLSGDISPVLTQAGDVAIIVGGKGEVIGLDALDGSLLYSLPLPGGKCVLTPTLGKSFSRNVLYAASADGTVSALDVRSGDLLWVLPAIGKIVGPTAAPITADGTTLIYATQDKGLLGVATDLGREVWGYAANPTDVSAVAAVVSQGKKAVVPTNRGLTHIDLATGAETWILPIEASFTPAVSPDGALVYVLSSKDRALRSVRADDGKVMWRVTNTSGPAFSAAPALNADGKILVVPLHGKKKKSFLAAHSTHNGEKLWSFPLKMAVVSSPVIGKTADGKKETVYFGSLDKHIHAIDLATGKELWAAATDGWITGTPTLSPDGETLYAGSEDNVLYALNTQDGKTRWSHPIKGGMFTSPALSKDGKRLALTSRSGAVMLLDTDPGITKEGERLKWAIHTAAQLGGPAFSVGDLALYVGTDAGELLAIEASSGRLFWTYDAVGPITTTPTVVPPQGGLVLTTTANGILSAIRALPAGHERAEESLKQEARDKAGSHYRGGNKGQQRVNTKALRITGIVLLVACALALLAIGGLQLARRHQSTKQEGGNLEGNSSSSGSGVKLPSFPSMPSVRMADLSNFQRPRGSVPLTDPDSGINVGRSEVEMEVI